MKSTFDAPADLGAGSGISNSTAKPVSEAEIRTAENPTIVIQSQGQGAGAYCRDVWAHRELLYFLVWRDLKVRYKQTVLGAAWAVLQPFLTMVVFTLFFGKLAQIPSDGVPYPIFAYAGLLPWTFFSNAVINSGNSMITNSSLITKIYFPRVIIPASAVVAALFDFVVAGLLLLGMMVYYDVRSSWQVVIIAPVMLFMTLFAIGLGTFMAGLNVKYRDVRHALPFFVQLWMFATPIIYPSNFVPLKWRWLLGLNPLAGMIEGFRSGLFGLNIKWSDFVVAAGLTAMLSAYSLYSFKRMESGLADII